DLGPDDFAALRSTLSKTRGPVALGNEIQRVRVVFKYAKDNRLITEDVNYGSMFKRPSKKVIRLAKASKGVKLFNAGDIRSMIEKADVQLRAMILLAVNCGFGNSDCGTMPNSKIDLEG